MFKCFDRQDNREVIILDSEWDGDGLNQLRSHGHSASLLCPECKQPVVVKAGEVKAWHFAHKDLGSCPLQSESPAILKARSLLYAWLRTKFQKTHKPPFDQAVVTVEKKMGMDIPRPVDCFVEFPNEQGIAYWIFDKGLRERASLVRGWQGIRLQPVFLTDMLRPAEGHNSAFDLTTTERDFLATSMASEYNKPYATGGSLHYLEKDAGYLTTLRGVQLLHGPQRYKSAAVLVHSLSEILTNISGEFIHPGEHDTLQAYRRQEEERQKRIERAAAAKARLVPLPPIEPPKQAIRLAPPPQPVAKVEPQQPDLLMLRLNKKIPMTCKGCGKETTDWTSCQPSAGMCLCRACGNKL